MSETEFENQNVIVKSIWTKVLVDELKTREGVFCTEIAPYEDSEIKTSGPAIVLTVID